MNHGLIMKTPPNLPDTAGSPAELGTNLQGSTGHDAGSKLPTAGLDDSFPR